MDYFGQPLSPVSMRRRDAAEAELDELLMNSMRSSDEEEQESQERTISRRDKALSEIKEFIKKNVTRISDEEEQESQERSLIRPKNLLSSLPPSQAESELEDINNKSNIQELDLWLRKQMKRNWEEEEKKCRKRSRVTKGSEGSQGNSTRTEPWSTAGSEGSQGNDRIGDKKLDDSTGSDAK
ncbi:hypothetical protein HNY73_015298 [Argiope bruennichi]|uniref:Uncharacterized protein n=1 Tax=Argiope bruennichi TaxID=94029 RepID=A0A8T0ETL1_ARGBR|nr:hypothetical protein HNY73_015298 [Argiope bruennichi]